MARRQKTTALAFDALSLEGALIAPAMLARIAAADADGQDEAGYHIPKGLTLREEMSRYFRIGQALFKAFRAGETPSHFATVKFVEELLRDVFGFADIARTGHRTLGGRTFAVTLEALGGRAPVVVVPPADGLDKATEHLPGDGRRRSAASAIQDWLNAAEGALWGLCTNGLALRLVRDNESLTRPAYIEADLARIFEDEAFADFTALWLLVHASRFGAPGAAVTDCPLERWREAGAKEGIAARERLRGGFEAALLALGTGFLQDPGLRARLLSGELAGTEFFSQLLHLVYRLIFLFVAEDRGLLHPPSAGTAARRLYAEGYSVTSLRQRAVRRANWDAHGDRWQGLLVTFQALRRGEPRLGLPALGGLFGGLGIDDLDRARLPNRALMEAVFRLAWLRDGDALMPVNWRDMETEELGSVYEGLLELTPRLGDDGRRLHFAEGAETRGNARKTTGSYYTPDSLVQALLDSALDPVLDRVEAEAHDPAEALLGVTVIDPACGSGHFLLAAARRIATRVARARAGGVASAEDYRHALRDVARRSIHGVDRNPMAVELTKVALWIETVEPGKPLGFLDANIRCGDALLGVFDMKVLEQGIPDEAYKPLTGDDKEAAKVLLKDNRAQRERQGDLAAGFTQDELAAEAGRVLALPEDDVEDIERKRQAYEGWRKGKAAGRGWLAADLYVAAFLRPKRFRATGMARAHVPDRVPTTVDVRAALAGRIPQPETMAVALDVARAARAFHWPLEFPAIMAKGGFDLVIGNPPWERIKLQEQEFFAARAPEIAEAPNAAARGRMIAALTEAEEGSPKRALFEEFETTKRVAEASSVFARVPGENGGRFPLTGRGDVNTYALFAEHFTRLVGPRGRAGVIVPTGVATDATTAAFFSMLIDDRRLISLHDFQTGMGFFDSIGHARFKFCLVTLGAGGIGPTQPEFSFFSRTIGDYQDSRRHFTLGRGEIARINPNTKTAPVFRSRADAELTAKIYARVPVLIDESKGKDGNPWGLSFMAMFHMSNDSGLFRTAAQLAEAGFVRDGTDWLAPRAATPQSALLHREAGEGDHPKGGGGGARYVPLYEAKMIHHFDHRWATYDEGASGDDDARGASEVEKANNGFEITPRYWAPAQEVNHRLSSKGATRGWLLGWRDITNAGNERTVISAVFPRAAVGNSLPLMVFNRSEDACALAALSSCLASLTCDYFARHKVGGSHLNFFTCEQLAVLPPSAYSLADLAFITPRALELTYTSHSMAPFARDLGYDGPPFTWDEDRRALHRAELDAFYARKYGLTRDELRYILDPADVMGPDYPSETFRVLRKNEIAKYNEYRTARLVLDAWDRMERGELALGAASTSMAARSTDQVAPVATTELANGAWATPRGGSVVDRTTAQLAALAKALPGAVPAPLALRAAVYTLEPRLLTPHLDATKQAEWLRLVGAEAEPRQGVPTLGLGGAAGWGQARRLLVATGGLIEDSTAATWARGTGLDTYETDGWPKRAEFALECVLALFRADSATSDEEAEAILALAA